MKGGPEWRAEAAVGRWSCIMSVPWMANVRALPSAPVRLPMTSRAGARFCDLRLTLTLQKGLMLPGLSSTKHTLASRRIAVDEVDRSVPVDQNLISRPFLLSAPSAWKAHSVLQSVQLRGQPLYPGAPKLSPSSSCSTNLRV